MTNERKRYQVPECEYDVAILKEMFCSSPVDGGLEGVGEEDWVL